MPGHIVSRSSVKNPALFDEYQCPYCNHLLKDAVQPICGHWLCECCADELLAESLPKCPKVDCQEYLKSDEEGAEYFPDRFVRKEIERMINSIVGCPHQLKGCQWEGRLAKLEVHLKACDFHPKQCNLCGVVLTPDQIESHGRVCPKELMKCPLAGVGCRHTRTITREELKQHVNDHGLEHLQSVVDALKLLRCPHTDESSLKYVGAVEEEQPLKEISPQPATSPHTKVGHKERNRCGDSSSIERLSDEGRLNELAKKKVAGETGSQLETIVLEKEKEKTIVKNHFDETRPSLLVEMSMHDVWKITKFSQQLTDALLGKCPSIFSLPFYTGPCGYKMCLQLYILGDGIGKNTHMSLFFVIMKGDCDDTVQWPFTSKVTFKLINQTGGRDIINTFQADPGSMSFELQKPKEAMNVASGCPLFVAHSELNTDGFIVDDTICINCCVSPP